MATDSANALTAFNPEYWRRNMQATFFKESTAIAVADVRVRDELRDGDTLHQPYGSYPRVQTYTKGSDITVKDIDSTDDTLTVDTAKVASFYVDDIDKLQNKWDTASEFSAMAGKQLTNVLDQVVMSHYTDANKTIDAGDIGGTAGNGIVLTSANAFSIYSAAGRVLNAAKRTTGDKFALIGPRILEVLQNTAAGRETGFGDSVGMNGTVGPRFGFNNVLSNNLPWVGSLEIDTQPTDGDTVVINGVTFTFKTALTGSSTLGEVLIGADAAAARVNLVKAVNDAGTVDTHYSALSSEDRQLIEESGIVATDNIAGTQVNFTGYGDIVTSETFTAATNVWHDRFQYALMGIRGSVSLLTQKMPNVEFRTAELRLGRYVHPWTLYGSKVFHRNKTGLVAVKFDVSSWV